MDIENSIWFLLIIFHIKDLYTLIDIKGLGRKALKVKNMSEELIDLKKEKGKGERIVEEIIEKLENHSIYGGWDKFFRDNVLNYYYSFDDKKILEIVIDEDISGLYIIIKIDMRHYKGYIEYKYYRVDIKKRIKKEIIVSLTRWLGFNNS